LTEDQWPACPGALQIQLFPAKRFFLVKNQPGAEAARLTSGMPGERRPTFA
jgi:hypothetical protein